MACTACGRDFHEECEMYDCYECHEKAVAIATEKITGVSTRVKPDELVTDVLSTGRKRAAKLYGPEMEKTLPCEWRGKKNVGGGIPIIGCINGFRQDIHHGPDKNTLNNQRENVHLICKKCHKRWHYTNDSHYNRDTYITTKHEPVDATHKELYDNELKWIKVPRGDFKVNEDGEE